MLAAVALVLSATGARAACDSTASCLEAVDRAQDETRTIRARFEQVKRLQLLDEPLVSTGRFVFKRPDKMRLEIEQPRPAVILVNGRRVAIPNLPASETQGLGLTPMAAMFTELGAMFGGSTARLTDHFAVDARPSDGGVYVTLTPTLEAWQRLFRTIELRFGGPELTIRQMRLDDALGDRLEITFRDVERNRDVPDSLFELPPAGE